MAVEKAREFNMPQDNIKRAIARGCGSERRARDRRDSLRRATARSVSRSSSMPRPITATARPANCAFCSAEHGDAWARPAASAGCSTRSASSRSIRREIRRRVHRRSAGRRRRGHRIRCGVRHHLHRSGEARRACATRCGSAGLKISDVYLGMRAKTKIGRRATS